MKIALANHKTKVMGRIQKRSNSICHVQKNTEQPLCSSNKTVSFVSHKKHLLNSLASCLVWAYAQHHLCSHAFQMVGVYGLSSLFINRRHPEVTPEVSRNRIRMLTVTLTFLKMSTQWLHFLHGHILSKCPSELAACSSLPMTPPTWTQAVISPSPSKCAEGSGVTAQSS